MKLKWTTKLMGLCLTAALFTSTPAAAQKPTELTFSVWIPQTHVLVANFMIPWAHEVEKATDNRVKITFLPKPVTNPQGHYDAVRNGVVDLTFISHSYYPGRFDLMKFAMLPFSGNSSLSTSVAAWRIYDKYLAAADEHKGVKVLGLYGHGPGGVFTTNKVIEKIGDFKNLKVRIGGGMAADVATALDANPVVKPAPESYELMSTGVVDGVFFPLESVPGFRLEGIVKNATLFPGGLYADTHAIIMNEQAFAKLSPKDQQILMNLSGEHIARLGGKVWGDADTAALNTLRANHVTFHQASPQLIADVKARTASFEKAWLDAAKAKGIDGPKVLKEFHADLQQLESGK